MLVKVWVLAHLNPRRFYSHNAFVLYKQKHSHYAALCVYVYVEWWVSHLLWVFFPPLTGWRTCFPFPGNLATGAHPFEEYYNYVTMVINISSWLAQTLQSVGPSHSIHVHHVRYTGNGIPEGACCVAWGLPLSPSLRWAPLNQRAQKPSFTSLYKRW